MINKPSSLIIVLHEIYGVNAHIQTVRSEFTAAGLDVICPNLLPSGRVYAHSEAAEAYDVFMQQVGFISAQRQINSLCREKRRQYDKIFILGFSIGATVAWLCSQSADCDGAICFYGSRIRSYTRTIPRCPVLLIFPRREDSFSVELLTAELSGRPNIQIERVPALHGFADPWSEAFCPKSRQSSMQRVLDFVQNEHRKGASSPKNYPSGE